MSLRARLAVLLALLLAGCAGSPLRELLPGAGTASLAAAVRHYDEGEAQAAERALREALALGLSDSERVRAHKYLAFLQCGSGRERGCRESFQRALAIDPEFTLSAAEAGHPVWGGLFRSLKSAPPPFRLALEQYAAGEHGAAARSFNVAIREGLDDKERAAAHKHLAFLHCAAGREHACRTEFRRALAADAALELEPAEAGHPLWAPVFQSLKAGAAAAR